MSDSAQINLPHGIVSTGIQSLTMDIEESSPLKTAINRTEKEIKQIERDIQWEKIRLAEKMESFEVGIKKAAKRHEELTSFLKQLQALGVKDEGTKESTESTIDS